MLTALFIKLDQDFDELVTKVINKIQTETSVPNTVFVRANVPGDELWEIYLESIPTNPIFRERRYFDGNYDKNFIRRIGGLIFIRDGKKSTIWDVNLKDTNIFVEPVRLLHEKVMNAEFGGYFLEKEPVAGHDQNRDEKDWSIIWNHFYLRIPSVIFNRNRDMILSDKNTNLQVLRRSLTDVRVEDLDTVLDLIHENAIYRGNEHENTLNMWKNLKLGYDQASDKEIYLVEKADQYGQIRLRNTVIGSLVNDLFDNVELEPAVRSFEAKVAPANYKRTNSVITAKQVEDAKAKLAELGYLDTIYREFAAEIPSEHVLFRTVERPTLTVFDDLVDDAKKTVKKIDQTKIVDVELSQFLDKLPELHKVELLPTAALTSHQMVLTKGKDDKSMFKWGNHYAWSYLNSDTTDAIKERVKQAGGNVEGDVRVSLAWSNHDDLDLHCATPKGHLFFGDKRKASGALDVDMHVSSPFVDNPVENIVWDDIHRMPDGQYDFYVDQYTKRENHNQGLQIQVEILGDIKTYSYNGQSLPLALTLIKTNDKVEITYVSDKLQLVSETFVNADDKFIEVTQITKSPNFWEDSVGNEHVFFITNDFQIEKPVRGFFNEYLDQDLNKHRKVFEIMGQKLKISDGYDSAVRGYGFSRTLHESMILRIEDSNGRKQVIRVNV